MLNTFVLLGKVHSLPNIGKSVLVENNATVEIECQRAFLDDGPASDIFMIRIWRGIAESCKAACKVGSVIAVKGRIEINRQTKEVELIAEKISYIS